MGVFSQNIYENVRTRTIVLRQGCILLHPPELMETIGPWEPGAWGLPGGGLEPHEALADCARREVFEETGLVVHVGAIAFLQEWVVPRYSRAPEPGDGHGYGLEVFHYAYPEEPASEPRSERRSRSPARWVPLVDVPGLPIWPKYLKDLCLHLHDGTAPQGCPSFIIRMGESPWARSDRDPFAPRW